MHYLKKHSNRSKTFCINATEILNYKAVTYQFLLKYQYLYTHCNQEIPVTHTVKKMHKKTTVDKYAEMEVDTVFSV